MSLSRFVMNRHWWACGSMRVGVSVAGCFGGGVSKNGPAPRPHPPAPTMGRAIGVVTALLSNFLYGGRGGGRECGRCCQLMLLRNGCCFTSFRLAVPRRDEGRTLWGWREIGEMFMVNRFEPKVCQIGPKWDKSRIFSDQIQYILARSAKMY